MRKPKSLGNQPAGRPTPLSGGDAAGPGPDVASLFEHLPWGVVVLDAHGTVRHLNQQAAVWWGLAPPDLVGKRLGPATAGTLPDDLQQALQQVTGSPEQPPGEFFLPRHQQWIAMSSTHQGDDRMVYWQDITAQKQHQHAQDTRQAAADTLLRRTEAAARTGSYALELATGSLEFSDGLFRLFGEEPGAFVPELALVDARSHPDDVAPVQQVLAQAIADRQPYVYQRRIYRADGQLRTLECHGRVECDAQAQPLKLLGLVQDVTEREQAAQALLRAKDELAQRDTDSYLALYHSMDEGFCVVDVLFDEAQRPVDYRFLNVNPAFEQQSGLHRALGKTIRELVPAIEPVWADVYGRVAQTGEPTRFEANVESMGRWFDINAFPIGSLPRRHVGVLFTDITARKHAESALGESDARLRQAVGLAHLGICHWDYRQDVMRGNDERFLMLGLDPAQGVLSVAQAVALTHPDDREATWAGIREELEALGEFRASYRIVRPGDGAVRWLSEVGRVVEWHQEKPAHVSSVLLDVTADREAAEVLRQSEARQTYLLALSDALRSVADPVAVQAAVTRTALHYFAADRCYYAEVAGDTAIIRRDAVRPGLPSVAGRYSLREMPLFNTVLREGRPAVVADVAASPAVDAPLKQLCREYRVLAYLSVPVFRDGELVGLLGLTQATPRAWTALEVALVQETAERTWAAVQQAQAEEALRRSEEQFRLFVTASSDVLYRVDAGWQRVLHLNGRSFIVDTTSPRATWLETYIPPPDQPAVEAAMRAAIAGRQFYELEHRVFRVDGSVGWVFSRAVPVFDARGELVEWFGTATDITARKHVEEALQTAEAKYRTLFETMDQGFGIAELLPGAGPGGTTDFRWLEINPQVERLTGMPQAALLSGRTMRTVVPQLEDMLYEQYEQVALTGESMRFEQYAQVLGRWFDVYVYALDGPESHRIALLFSNITARKQAEEDLRLTEERHREHLEQQVAVRTEQLQESRHLLQTVFDASPTAIVVMRILRDAAGQAEDFEILIFNAFNQQVVGRDDLAGQRFTAMFPQTVPTGVLARLLQVATTGEPADFEGWYEGEGLQHWFRHIAVRQDDLLVLTSEVITARKLLEVAQTRSLALLQQTEAVAGMGSWEYDLLTRAFTWSDGLYRLFEQPVGSTMKPQFLLDAVLDDDRPAAARLVRTLTAAPRSFDTTLRLRIGAAVKTVRFKAVPLPDAPGPPERVLGVCLDVSDVQRLEAENLALKLDRHKELLMAILQAQETERQRLGEVLHNGLGQILYATKLRLDQLDSPALQALPTWAELHQETARLLAEAMRQNRTLAHELVPTSLLNFGLAAAVRDVCRDLSTPQLRIACQVWDEELELEKTLPQPVQVTLFRLAQELALNIVRHAGATEATLELETMAGGVSLRAEDNGRGFDPRTVTEGLGLRTVRDAVALLGGTVAVDSSPEFGTHIRLRIPLPLFSQP